jgi:hypothetical protein
MWTRQHSDKKSTGIVGVSAVSTDKEGGAQTICGGHMTVGRRKAGDSPAASTTLLSTILSLSHQWAAMVCNSDLLLYPMSEMAYTMEAAGSIAIYL